MHAQINLKQNVSGTILMVAEAEQTTMSDFFDTKRNNTGLILWTLGPFNNFILLNG